MIRHLIVVVAGSFAAASLGIVRAQDLPTPPQASLDPPGDVGVADEAGVEVQMRGPVHEAFAEPVSIDAQAPTAITQEKPPEAVDEIPPDARTPEDASAVWIPGYWNWDDVAKRYLWVSGVWRLPPSGQRWVPGYWTEAQGGYQRVNGFWSPVAEQQVEYLPSPPATLEEGPNVAAPSENHFWIPGCWVYGDQDYRWRPGYWYATNPDYMWVPDRYNWTPRGYVYCNGYWDYSDWSRRGVLFAPVYFNRPLYQTAGYYYTPQVLINVGFLTNHFFHRPGYRHYYFGDYYGGSYLNLGFHHRYSWNRWGRGWDPYYNHFRWTHSRHNHGWHDDWRDRYDYYARKDGHHLPHTWKDARDWDRRDRDGDRDHDRPDWDRDRHVAASVDEVLRNRDRSQYQLTKLDDKDRARYRDRSNELRDLARQRGESEARNRGEGREGRESSVVVDRDRDRGSFRLPDSEQFRRSASRNQRNGENDTRGQGQRNREAVTRGDGDRDQLGREGQEGERNRNRGERQVDGTPGQNTRPGDSDSRVTTRRQLDEIQRNGQLRGEPGSEAIPRGSDVTRRNGNGERLANPDGRRREVGRPPEDTSTVEPSRRTVEDQRRSDAVRQAEARQQFERSRTRPEFDGNRRLGQPPAELRRGESSRSSELRPGTPSTEGQRRFESRDGGQSPSSIQRRNFTPPSEGSLRQQQVQRPQSRSNFDSAPRSAPRMESRSRGGGENQSFRSSGENRSSRSGGGENRSFQSRGSSDRGGSSAFRGGGGGGRRGDGGGGGGGGGGRKGGKGKD